VSIFDLLGSDTGEIMAQFDKARNSGAGFSQNSTGKTFRPALRREHSRVS
jgi:hypothetical protein